MGEESKTPKIKTNKKQKRQLLLQAQSIYSVPSVPMYLSRQRALRHHLHDAMLCGWASIFFFSSFSSPSYFSPSLPPQVLVLLPLPPCPCVSVCVLGHVVPMPMCLCLCPPSLKPQTCPSNRRNASSNRQGVLENEASLALITLPQQQQGAPLPPHCLHAPRHHTTNTFTSPT